MPCIENLNLTEYVINKNLPDTKIGLNETHKGELLYDLCAISNHSGNLHGGHYTAFCK